MRISDWSSDVCSSDLRRICLTDLPAHGEAIFFWHHDIQNAEVKRLTVEGLNGFFSIGAQGYHVVSLQFQVFLQERAEVGVIFYKQDIRTHDLDNGNVISNVLPRFSSLRSEEHTSELQSL